MTAFAWPRGAPHVADALPVAWLEFSPGEFGIGTQRRGTLLDFRATTIWTRHACPPGCVGHKCPEKSRHGAFACGLYNHGHRSIDDIVETAIIGFDIDDRPEAAVRQVLADLKRRGIAFIAHSTHRGDTGWRVFLPLAVPLKPKHWKGFRLWLASELPWTESLIDQSAKDISRLWYAPTAGVGAVEYVFSDGAPLRPLIFEPAPVPAPPAPLRTTTSSAPGTDRARAYLAAAGPAVEGAHGDDMTYRLACKLIHYFELKEAHALQLLGEWNAGCVPPWTEHALKTKVRNAARYGNRDGGLS
jgi:hypothetical protein